ncbi:MAG: ABC transporter permease [Alphaproteobacteria bacterium]|nr:ABC transporter permease [Alphaproteobacteria bacterium]
MDLATAIILTIVTASTPLLIAAAGELLVERAGVLNLGVEGMMIMGAACGFGAAHLSGQPWLGIPAGILAGMAMAALFAVMVLGLVANQVACGLALTILGLGLSGLIGQGFVGQKLEPIGRLHVPLLSDIPVLGPILFHEDPFVYASFALVLGLWWFLGRTRAGLVVRAVGDNHASAHALGYPVRRVRLLAILFGGGCAGLAGAYLSLVYTPFWVTGMSAGRGWIALALVVFASWRPWRLLFGAYLFGTMSIGQLHLQAMRGVLPEFLLLPGQFWSALPYAATIVVLVAISRSGRRRGAEPAMLGQTFVPDR